VQELETLISEAEAAVTQAPNLEALDQLRVQYLGKKGQLTEYLKGLKHLSVEERPQAGQAVNRAKPTPQESIEARDAVLN